MSALLDRAAALGSNAPRGGASSSSALGAPIAAAARALAGAVTVIGVPVVFAWVLGAGGDVSWTQAVRFALTVWLLAQHTGLAVEGGHVGLVPLGLAAIPLTACWYAGRRLARAMDPRADRIASGASRARPALLSWQALVGFCLSYATFTFLLATVVSGPGLRPIAAQALLGSLVFAATGGGLGAAAYRCGGPVAGMRAVVRRAPAVVRAWVRPAAGALAVQIGSGAVLVLSMLIAGSDRVMALHRAVGPGIAGGLVLTLAELLLLPNLVLWAAAALAGPGFAVGAGTSVTVLSSSLGPLPAVPVLAALPAPGAAAPAAMILFAAPAVAGFVAGVVVVRRHPAAGLTDRLRVVAGVGLTSAVALGGLAWLSGGPVGPGRMAVVGPSPWQIGGAFGLEVGAMAALVVLVVRVAGPWLAGRGLTLRPRRAA